MEYNIDTADVEPIKQPPNHFPMAFADEDHKVLAKLQVHDVI